MNKTNQHIYIVEDQGITRSAIKNMLENAGYFISGESATAEKAWIELQESCTQLVLLDFNLKGTKNGLWLAEKINSFLQIPFIFLTAYGNEDFLKRILASNPASYIMKPYNKPTLLTAVRIAIDNNEQQHIKTHQNNEVFIKTRTVTFKFTPTNLYYLQSNKNYIEIYTTDGKFEIREKLENVIEQLNFKELYRVHRRFAVNQKFVTKIEQAFVYINEIQIPISKSYDAEEFFRSCVKTKLL